MSLNRVACECVKQMAHRRRSSYQTSDFLAVLLAVKLYQCPQHLLLDNDMGGGPLLDYPQAFREPSEN